MPDYPPPVDRLVSYRPAEFQEDWPDYPKEFGLGSEHVADLIRMATDPELYRDDIREPAIYAPIHARRALGQLRAVEAIRPLLETMDEFGHLDDYWSEELPDILALIGPEAIPAIVDRLADRSADEYTRIACGEALAKIAERSPEARDDCVGHLNRQLARKEDGAYALNAFLISNLVDLKASESAPLIEEAFAADVVDESIAGDWPYTRYKLGLGPKPPPRRYQPFGLGPGFVGPERANRPDPKKLSRKRKAEKQARKQGRKRR